MSHCCDRFAPPSPGTVRTPLGVYGSVTARSDKTHFLWIILRWQSLHTTSVFLCLAIIAISHRSLPLRFLSLLNSVYTRSGQNSTPNSNATNLHSSQKRCCSFCISSSNASPTFQVQKSIFHQMTKPIQVTVILPLLLAISFSRNDDIHSSISGISNDLIGVIPTIGQ